MYTCNVCEKTFASSSKLGGHRSGHTRRKEAIAVPSPRMNGKCPDCEKTFDSSYKLAGHRRLMHSAFESFKTDSRRKRRLLEERGHKCEVCNTVEWCGQLVPIEIDHVDGDPENNKRENLRLICPNCHAQTSTYKGKNMGKITNSKRQKKLKKYVGKYR